MAKLLDTVAKQTDNKKTTGANEASVSKVTEPDQYAKTQTISAKVNPEMWSRFKRLSRMSGSTANGMLNQLINNYVITKDKEFRDLDAI